MRTKLMWVGLTGASNTENELNREAREGWHLKCGRALAGDGEGQARTLRRGALLLERNPALRSHYRVEERRLARTDKTTVDERSDVLARFGYEAIEVLPYSRRAFLLVSGITIAAEVAASLSERAAAATQALAAAPDFAATDARGVARGALADIIRLVWEHDDRWVRARLGDDWDEELRRPEIQAEEMVEVLLPGCLPSLLTVVAEVLWATEGYWDVQALADEE